MKLHESWSSKTTFILATLGASVGLGNLWRFPYVAGENGGGAFVLIYIAFVLIIGIPLVAAELAMGRSGAQSPINTIRQLQRKVGASPLWNCIGWLSVVIPFLALSYYSVIAGWSFDYLITAVNGGFADLSTVSSQAAYDSLLASPSKLTLWHSLYLAIVIFVVGMGIRRGIEKVALIMMPMLFVLLVVLAIYGLVAGDAARGIEFLFKPRFSELSGEGILTALGQALFSVSIGTGARLTFGAYLTKDINIPQSATILCLADTGASLLAGLAIFPIVFAAGLDPAGGPGLTFVVLPVAFGGMAGGSFFATLFFILFFFAAVTSSIAMLEPVVSWLEEHQGFQRFKVACFSGSAVWLIGLASVFSFNIWQDFKPLSIIPVFKDRNIFQILDFLIANLMLPANALLIALFAGWIISHKILYQELGFQDQWRFRGWLIPVRYVAPVALTATFIFYLLQG